jgi:hypothetical protein
MAVGLSLSYWQSDGPRDKTKSDANVTKRFRKTESRWEANMEDSVSLRSGRERSSQPPWIKWLAVVSFVLSLSPVLLCLSLIGLTLVSPDTFEPAPGNSSVLLSEGAGLMFVAVLLPWVLVPLALVMAVVSLWRAKRTGSGRTHPLAWAAILLSVAYLAFVVCSNLAFLPLGWID